MNVPPSRKLSAADTLLQEAFELAAAGATVDAAKTFRRVLAKRPGSALALHGLGMLHYRLGEAEKSIGLLGAAAHQAPANARIWNDLGMVQATSAHFDEAEACFRRAIVIDPILGEAVGNLSNLMQIAQRFPEAEDCARRAIALQPNSYLAHNYLGNSLVAQSKVVEAIEAFKTSVALAPQYLSALTNLGKAFAQANNLAAADQVLRTALSIQPASLAAREGLALVASLAGNATLANELHGEATLLTDATAATFSSFLLSSLYLPNLSNESLFGRHKDFGTRFKAKDSASAESFVNARDPDRPLKIGYVSGDFREHSLANFILPVFESHDRQRFRTHAYYCVGPEDDMSGRIRAAVDVWHGVHRLNDHQLLELVKHDGIDILVDLSGHTAHHRLPMFAMRAAPIQMTWLGYLGTTGLATMDYRLTDKWLDPQGMTETLHTEQLLRLAHTYAPFRPMLAEELWPPVSPLPAIDNGGITFGSFNNPFKISSEAIAVWARTLARVPNSRMVIANGAAPEVQARFSAVFAEHGVDETRVTYLPKQPLQQYLEQHRAVDIVLDSFPHSGGTISCYALFMGVPVVTKAGAHPAHRAGASAVARVGLESCIVETDDAYVTRAVHLAADLPALAALRVSLRARLMEDDPNGAKVITQCLEKAYRDAWRRYCAA